MQQLRWRMRRGMKELDVLLERYFPRLERASPEEQRQLSLLLDREDPEILQWVLQQAPVPPEFAEVIDALRRHN